ncbi:unnamed protein product [Soboliphyme baturini]|uniref:Uncharacterized protein n=1 Tax=Soboliphyme baturini TaxID=241478 RepID=A0A183J5V2_9BILA|nr:unnamed protein product [Soboliphyme baturini]
MTIGQSGGNFDGQFCRALSDGVQYGVGREETNRSLDDGRDLTSECKRLWALRNMFCEEESRLGPTDDASDVECSSKQHDDVTDFSEYFLMSNESISDSGSYEECYPQLVIDQLPIHALSLADKRQIFKYYRRFA